MSPPSSSPATPLAPSPFGEAEAARWFFAHARDLFAVVSSGQVKIRIDQRYPLADVQQAHRDLEARKTTGCSILLP